MHTLETTIPELDHPDFVHREHYSDAARATLRELDSRVAAVQAEVEAMPGWKVLFDSATPNEVVLAIFREVYLSVVAYQPHTTEASFHWLGRLPKSEHRLIRSLVNHKAEEAEHGEWALRDYLALGGTTARASEVPTPPMFMVAAAWWRMAYAEDPFGYLGAEYLFESLTAQVSQPLLPMFQERKLPADGLGFLVEHATEDIKHTNLIVHHVLDVATRHPASGAAMLRCFDYFRHVYPIPVWSEAIARALNSH